MRWTVVFHRKAENWFFALIALGEFKRRLGVRVVPRCPACGWSTDVGFRRTRLYPLPDTPESKAFLRARHHRQRQSGEAMPVRTDAFPVWRLGSVLHQCGQSSDRIARRCVATRCPVRLLSAPRRRIVETMQAQTNSAAKPIPIWRPSKRRRRQQQISTLQTQAAG